MLDFSIWIYSSVNMLLIYGTGKKAHDNQSSFTAQTWGEIFIHKNQFPSGSKYTEHVYKKLFALNL